MPGTQTERVQYGDSIPPELRAQLEAIRGEDMTRRTYAELGSTHPIVKVRAPEVFDKLFDHVLKAAERYPEFAKAKKVLGSYRAFMEHFIKGDLYLDLRDLKQSGRYNYGEGTLFKIPDLSEEEAKALKEKLAAADRLFAK